MAPATRAKGVAASNLVELINSSPAGKKKAAEKKRKEAERKAADSAKKAEKLEAAKAKKAGKKSAEKEQSIDYSIYDKETAILLKQSDAQIAFNADKAEHYSDLLLAIDRKKHADAVPIVKAKIAKYTSYVDDLRKGRAELLNSATPSKGKKKATVPEPNAFISSGEYFLSVFSALGLHRCRYLPRFFVVLARSHATPCLFLPFYEILHSSNPPPSTHHARTTPPTPSAFTPHSQPIVFSLPAIRLFPTPRRQRRCTRCDPPFPRNWDCSRCLPQPLRKRALPLVPITTPTKTGLGRRCLPPPPPRNGATPGAYHHAYENGLSAGAYHHPARNSGLFLLRLTLSIRPDKEDDVESTASVDSRDLVSSDEDEDEEGNTEGPLAKAHGDANGSIHDSASVANSVEESDS